MVDYDPVKQLRWRDPDDRSIVLITANTPREFVEMVQESEWNYLDMSELRIRRPGDPGYVGRGRSVS